MSLVSSGIEEIHRKTLTSAIDGFCTTLKGSQFLNDLMTRAQNFCKGNSTSGDVPTFIVAIADQMALLWGYQNNYQIGSDSLDISNFSTSKYWQTIFLRLLRDKLDVLFTAFCRPDDVDGNAKRNQKEVDAEELIEILVQGLNSADDPYGLQHYPIANNLSLFFEQFGSYGISSKGSNEINLEAIKLSVPSDGTIDICDFVEEETLDALSSFFDESPKDVRTVELTPPPPTSKLNIPSVVDELIASLLETKRK
jgi:hypothetical protein